MPPSTRVATCDDAPALARIAQQALPEGWSESALRETLARPGARAFVSEPVRGFVLGWRSADEAEILTLAVEKEARGSGLGRALLVALLERLRSEGVRSVSLEVRSSNAAARGLYQAQGFETRAVRRNYYRDGEDALLLGAEL